ncbi:hypothetical protein ACPV5O_26495 [Vibrio maritimus]|uniref:hypothetical protein n=1 Tax=Vibrio maritimus TaxID=990268 RepID=UPI0040678209
MFAIHYLTAVAFDPLATLEDIALNILKWYLFSDLLSACIEALLFGEPFSHPFDIVRVFVFIAYGAFASQRASFYNDTGYMDA